MIAVAFKRELSLVSHGIPDVPEHQAKWFFSVIFTFSIFLERHSLERVIARNGPNMRRDDLTRFGTNCNRNTYQKTLASLISEHLVELSVVRLEFAAFTPLAAILFQ